MIIKNIRRGYTKSRFDVLYAELYNDKGDLLISATLEYIMERLPTLLDNSNS